MTSTQQEKASKPESTTVQMDDASIGSGILSQGRKRSRPSDVMDELPPNKQLPSANMLKQKQILYKKVAEAERNPFFLHPHQVTPLFPFLPVSPATATSTVTGTPPANAAKFSPVYPLMQASPPKTFTGSSGLAAPSSALFSVPSTTATQASSFSAAPISSTGTANASGTLIASMAAPSTPPRPPYTAQFYAPFMKYPMSPPTPSGMSTLGVLSPWNIAAVSSIIPMDSSASSAKDGATNSKPDSQAASSTVVSSQAPSNPSVVASNPMTVSNGAPILPQHIMSPRPNFTSIHSPLSYLHASPLSPMMLIHSPYASSISSCPSVSSSSGCSSDGGNIITGQRKKHYAPSEYHVGPRRPLSEKLEEETVSEGANSSGRNTPVDNIEDETDNAPNQTAVENQSVLLQQLPSQGAMPSFTPFFITSQGPSAAQPATHSVPTGGGGGGGGTSNNLGVGGPSTVKNSGIDVTGQAVSYPYSVESLSHSVPGQPLSVESTSHGYLTGVHQNSSVERPSSGVSSMSSSLSSRDSTPDPEEAESMSQEPHIVNSSVGGMGGARGHRHTPRGSDMFCLVPGRLSLLSSTQKYKVTVDEVRRRLSHPECLNASVLGGILRRAKSKNGGHVLRQRLDSIGLSLPPGRRKATELSLLTSLVEGEATHLSSDFRRICETYFPHTELAQIIARQHAGTPQAQHRVSMVKAAQLVVSELQAMLNAVGGPSNIKPNDPNNPYPGLTNFSLLTHGFGNPAINTSLGVVQTYLQELLAFYEGRKPIQPDNRYMFSDKLHAPSLNGMHHPGYPGTMPGPIPDSRHPHGSQSVVSMKQEPMDSPRNCTL